MTIYDALRQDHDKVKNILSRLEEIGEGDEQTGQDLLTRLKQELEIHATFEEEVFYPAVAERQEAKEEIADAIDEHDEAMSIVEEMEDMDVASSEWSEQLGALSDALHHHIQQEETEIFELAQETVDQQRATQMAEDYARLKAERTRQSA